MKHAAFSLTAGLFLSLSFTAAATTLYVDVNNPAPAAPYTNWVTAATNIQDAVDASTAGDEVVVTNGVYQTGGRVVYGALANRLAVTKPVVVSSVNGPGVTAIKGYQVPGITNGEGAVRCVYLTNGAWLVGFTLTSGATRTNGDAGQEQSGGGVWCETSAVVSNCFLTGNSAAASGGGACYGTLDNCTLTGNSANGGGTASFPFGGGAYYCTLANCTLTGNTANGNPAGYGGGANSCTLTNCVLSGNSTMYGGGAYQCTLNNCTLTSNSAYFGGGALYGTLNNCRLSNNSAGAEGGGAVYAGLNNCALTGNSTAGDGGGASDCSLNNCTLTGNSAAHDGGGAYCYIYGVSLNNCILYYNSAPNGPNWVGGTLNYCCTTSRPPGPGNIAADPQLASAFHLSALSPCRGAGSAAYAQGTDIDGEPWANPPSIGCDELKIGAATGNLNVSLQVDYTNLTVGFAANFVAAIEGRLTASRWEFGDGIILSNRPYASHSWSTPGDYPVALRAYNGSNPGGVTATVNVRVVAQPVHYVALDSSAPQAPYQSWGTAATNIQDAVDAATAPGTLVLVSNGVYQAGGRAVYGLLTNRVSVDKALMVRSVNGPGVTLIRGCQVPGTTNGDGAVRCVYLTNGASLVGFTLTGGATRANGDWLLEQSGGGVWCETTAWVSNCVLTGNAARENGGGAYYGTLYNCTFTGNSATAGAGAYWAMLNNCVLASNSTTIYGFGGGACYGVLNNCTLTGNSATANGYSYGGGAYESTLNNCVIYYNLASNGPNYSDGTLNYCCTTPLIYSGVGNFTSTPLFIDSSGGNLRLASNSPCIDAGLNAYASGATDLDGRPRIVGRAVDVGAYEFEQGVSGLFIGWLQGYNLPTDGSADYADSDGDRMNNWQEWLAGTNPTNAASVLRVQSTVVQSAGVTLTWPSVTDRAYFVQRATNLVPPPAFSLLQTNIPGLPGTTSFTDTNPPPSGPAFYRVGVQQ